MNELVLSKIVKSTLNNFRIIDTISSYFDSEDALSPATQLMNFQELTLANDEFFVKARTEIKVIIKEWGAILAA